MKKTMMAALVTCAWVACASAQSNDERAPLPAATAAPMPVAPAIAEPTGCCRIAAGTVVDLEIMEPINSFRQHRGDYFALRLAEPVVVDGNVLLPAGTTGMGQVVHAAAAHSGGAPGELILAARHLDFAGRQLPLRGFHMGASGKDNSAMALGISIAAGPFALFIRGHEIEIPAGTRVNAKFAQDVLLQPASLAPSPSPSTVVSPQEH